jgi:hypothetical protein
MLHWRRAIGRCVRGYDFTRGLRRVASSLQFSALSTRRPDLEPGPILRGVRCWRRSLTLAFSSTGRGVWVPRCAIAHLRSALALLACPGRRKLFPRRDAPEWLMPFLPKTREQGMPDARCTRDLMCDSANKAAHEHTGQRRTSDIPCAMALRLISCSPQSGRARCHCRSLETLASSELDASKRGVRTTRLYRTLLSRSSFATSASTASHPTSVTIAIRPS